MKLLIVQDTDWIQRNPVQNTHLSERLVKQGYETRVIDYEILWQSTGKKELLSERQTFHVSIIIPNSDITVIRPRILKVPLLDYFSMLFTYSKEIQDQISEFKPDVIMGNDILTKFLAFRAARKHNIPALFYSIDIDHRLIPYWFLQPIGKFIESYNIKHADFVLSINEGLRDYTIKMGASPEKTAVIGAGIDLEKFDANINGMEIREKFGIKKQDFVLFFVGWLYHFSGLKEVATELVKIKDLRPDIKLLLVGDGDAYDDLKKIQEENHLENNIILAGKQPYDILPKYIAAANICILPAYDNEIMHDIVPFKLYEYMAMGKPIIATRLNGLMKEFGENHGLIYAERPEDVVPIAIDLINSGNCIIEGQKGRKFVEKSRWDNITASFDHLLIELLLKKKRTNK